MTTARKPLSAAVLQFEIDRGRWGATEGTSFQPFAFGEKPSNRLFNMARTAVCDTILNGGTFVLVATPEKITMIQRTDTDTVDD